MNAQTMLWLALAAGLLAVFPAAADDPDRITGEVVAMRHAVATANGAELDRLTLRTRNGEIRHLLLGEADACPDCVTVGDRVRVRVMAGDAAGEPLRVRTMKVRRTGETLSFRNEAGALVRNRKGQDGVSGARAETVRHKATAGSGRARGAGGPRR